VEGLDTTRRNSLRLLPFGPDRVGENAARTSLPPQDIAKFSWAGKCLIEKSKISIKRPYKKRRFSKNRRSVYEHAVATK